MLTVPYVLGHMVIRRITVVVFGLGAGGDYGLCGQVDNVRKAPR